MFKLQQVFIYHLCSWKNTFPNFFLRNYCKLKSVFPHKYKNKGLCYLKGYMMFFYIPEFIRMSTEYLCMVKINNLDEKFTRT